MYSYGPPHMAEQKHDDQHQHTFSSYVRIRNVALKTYQRRWTIGKNGERGSGISVLVAWHDDDDDGDDDDAYDNDLLLRQAQEWSFGAYPVKSTSFEIESTNPFFSCYYISL